MKNEINIKAPNNINQMWTANACVNGLTSPTIENYYFSMSLSELLEQIVQKWGIDSEFSINKIKIFWNLVVNNESKNRFYLHL